MFRGEQSQMTITLRKDRITKTVWIAETASGKPAIGRGYKSLAALKRAVEKAFPGTEANPTIIVVGVPER